VGHFAGWLAFPLHASLYEYIYMLPPSQNVKKWVNIDVSDTNFELNILTFVDQFFLTFWDGGSMLLVFL